MSGLGSALLGRCERNDLYNYATTIAPGNSHHPDLSKLATLGRERRREGDSELVRKVAYLVFYPTFSVAVSTVDGDVPSKRLLEMLELRQRPDGFPGDFSYNLYGHELDWLNQCMLGSQYFVQLAAMATDDGAVTKQFPLPVFYALPDIQNPADTAIDALSLGRGRTTINCHAVTADGVTSTGISALTVNCATFFSHPAVPVFFRAHSIDITARLNAGRLEIVGRRLMHLFFSILGGGTDSDDTNDVGSFDETVTVQWWLNGHQVIEDLRIDELVDEHNFYMYDVAAMVPRAVPTLLPFIGRRGTSEYMSKMPRGDVESRFEFSGNPRDTETASGTMRCTIQETLPVELRSREFNSYCQAVGLDPNAGGWHRISADKNVGSDPSKADAMPWRFKPGE